MSSRLRLRALSTVLALGTIALAAAPAAAATEVAKGAASAVTVTLAGNAQGTGVFTASNDGSTETTSGTRGPALRVLGGFRGLGAGVLNQDAEATPASRSTACAGVAGNGGLVQAGRSTCLRPSATLNLSAGTADLSSFDPGTDVLDSAFNKAILDNLPAGSAAVLTPLTGQLTSALTTAFRSGFAALQNPALSLDLGLIQGRCVAEPGNTSGAADLAAARIALTFPSSSGLGAIPLVSFDPDPAPNTPVVAGLGDIVARVVASLQSSLTGTLSAIPGTDPLMPIVTALSGTSAISDALATITSQLGPLDQVISGTLNKQTRPDDSSIDVTALDLDVLPAAAAVLNAPFANLQVGHVSCAAADNARVDAPAVTPPIADADVPSVIDSGLAGDASHADRYRTLLGALLLLGAGGIAVRRLLGARSAD